MSEQNLRPEDLDRLGQALLTLTKELWVVKDRVRILEEVLADANVIVPEAVDRYTPNAELQQQLEQERGELINQLLDTLSTGKQS